MTELDARDPAAEKAPVRAHACCGEEPRRTFMAESACAREEAAEDVHGGTYPQGSSRGR